MGHEAVELGPAHKYHRNRRIHNFASVARMAFPGLDEKAQGGIATAALQAQCELVINDDFRLMPEVVSRLKRNGVRVAFWFPDAVSHLSRQLMILSNYDALFFKDPHIVTYMASNLGLPVFYLPEACNTRWHRPLVPAGTDPCIVIAGSMYPYRVRILERLMSKGVPIRIYGVGIPQWLGDTPARNADTRRHIKREEKARVFRSAAAVLNTMDPAEVAGVNARLFESAGCGAAVLSEYRPTLPDLFDIGREVLAYQDFDELVSQATRVLTEPGLTGRLGDAATLRAHRDHSYEQRLKTILEIVS